MGGWQRWEVGRANQPLRPGARPPRCAPPTAFISHQPSRPPAHPPMHLRRARVLGLHLGRAGRELRHRRRVCPGGDGPPAGAAAPLPAHLCRLVHRRVRAGPLAQLAACGGPHRHVGQHAEERGPRECRCGDVLLSITSCSLSVVRGSRGAAAGIHSGRPGGGLGKPGRGRRAGGAGPCSPLCPPPPCPAPTSAPSPLRPLAPNAR